MFRNSQSQLICLLRTGLRRRFPPNAKRHDRHRPSTYLRKSTSDRHHKRGNSIPPSSTAQRPSSFVTDKFAPNSPYAGSESESSSRNPGASSPMCVKPAKKLFEKDRQLSRLLRYLGDRTVRSGRYYRTHVLYTSQTHSRQVEAH